MTQKIVIKVQMKCDKCRSKAMGLVAATGGVESVALAGEGKDQVVVVGNVDSVMLTSALRKKVGPAQLLQVDEAKKEAEKVKPAATAAAKVEYAYPRRYYCQYAPQPVPVVYEHYADAGAYAYQCHSRPDTCSIL